MSRRKGGGGKGAKQDVAPTIVMLPFIREYKTEHYGAEGDEGERTRANMVEDHQDLEMHAIDTRTVLQAREKKAKKKQKSATPILDSQAAIAETYLYPEIIYMGATSQNEKGHRLFDVPGIENGLNIVITAHGNPMEIGGKTLYSIVPEELGNMIDSCLASTMMRRQHPNIPRAIHHDVKEMDETALRDELQKLQEIREVYEGNDFIKLREEPLAKALSKKELEEQVISEFGALNMAYSMKEMESSPTNMRMHIDLQTCNSAYFPIEERHDEAARIGRGRYDTPEIALAVAPDVMQGSFIGKLWQELHELGYANISVSGYRGYTGQRSDKKTDFSVSSEEKTLGKIARASETMYSISPDGSVIVPRQWKFEVAIDPDKLLSRDAVFDIIEAGLGGAAATISSIKREEKTPSLAGGELAGALGASKKPSTFTFESTASLEGEGLEDKIATSSPLGQKEKSDVLTGLARSLIKKNPEIYSTKPVTRRPEGESEKSWGDKEKSKSDATSIDR